METTDGIQLEAVLEALPNLSIAELNTVEALLVKLREEKETEQRRQFLATMKKAAKEAGLPSDPGKTWTGRGKRPGWLQALLDGGTDLETMRI